MPKSREPLRLDVRKTYKLYINGAFVRSESGRSDVFSAGSTIRRTLRVHRGKICAMLWKLRVRLSNAGPG